MNANLLKALIFGFIISLPLILAKLLPQFKWVFFFAVSIEIYAMVSKRIRSKPIKYVTAGFLIYLFYRLWYVIGALFMFYWIAGSIGFGFISSIIIFGIKGD